MLKFATATLAAVLLVAGAPAAAATFTNKADFLLAVGAVTSNDLNTAPDVTSYDFGDFTATAILSGDDPYDADHFGFKPAALTTGKSLQFTPAGEKATFTFDSPIYAFGIDLAGLALMDDTDLIFTINEVEYNMLSFEEGEAPRLAFAGFTSTTAFSKVTISATGFDQVELDNVLYAGGVPEPSTWAMMLFGFGGVGFALRRRRPIAA